MLEPKMYNKYTGEKSAATKNCCRLDNEKKVMFLDISWKILFKILNLSTQYVLWGMVPGSV